MRNVGFPVANGQNTIWESPLVTPPKSPAGSLDTEAQVAHTFDDEERELLASFETEAWGSTPEAATLKPQLEAAARATLAKSEPLYAL